MIRSYEIGVLFLPQDFVSLCHLLANISIVNLIIVLVVLYIFFMQDSSEKLFRLSENQAGSNGVVLRLPFDLPVVPYSNEGIITKSLVLSSTVLCTSCAPFNIEK